MYRISGKVFFPGRRSKSDSGVVFLLCVVGGGGLQIQGPRTPRRLNFVPWVFAGPQYAARFSHPSDAWNFQVAHKFFGKFMHRCIRDSIILRNVVMGRSLDRMGRLVCMAAAQILWLMSVVTSLYIIVSQRGFREVSGFYSVQHDVQLFLCSVPDLRFIVITARKLIVLVIHFYSDSIFFTV